MNNQESSKKINKEQSKEPEENLKYYTTLFKLPKYSEKVNLYINNLFKIYILVHFLFKFIIS
jgi:uncharacterized FlgJ-related protein